MGDTRITKKDVTTSSSSSKAIPKGATIVDKDTSTDVEKIENGYLITKTVTTRYKIKPDSYTDYHYQTEKYFSKEDPLTITTTDKSLADLFDEENK